MTPPAIPTTENVAVLRFDFSDDDSWADTCALIKAATEEGFQDTIENVDVREYDGLDATSFRDLMRRVPDSCPHPLVFVADAVTMTDPEHTLFVAWAWKDKYEGQFMRCLPRDVLAIENNVIDNMPWEEFRDAVGDDGVCRIG